MLIDQWILGSKDHLGRHSGMCSSTFRVSSIGYTPLGSIFRGDRGQWELLEVRDTTSNTLDSIGYTPLGLGTGDSGNYYRRDTTSNTLDSIGYTPLGLGTGDSGNYYRRDTTSNTLDSIGYTPLGLIFSGGQWTGDRGQWELLEVSDTTSNTLDSIGYTSLDASIYLSIDTVAMYLRRSPKRAKT